MNNFMKIGIGALVLTFILILLAMFIPDSDPAMVGAFFFGMVGGICLIQGADQDEEQRKQDRK